MPKTKTRIWDPAEHLITDEDMAAYVWKQRFKKATLH